jgi:hypothetical protein
MGRLMLTWVELHRTRTSGWSFWWWQWRFGFHKRLWVSELWDPMNFWRRATEPALFVHDNANMWFLCTFSVTSEYSKYFNQKSNEVSLKILIRDLITGIMQEVLGTINLLLTSDRYGPHTKRRLQKFFVVARRSLPIFYLTTIRGHTDLQTLISWNMDGIKIRHPTSFLLLCVFLTAWTCLPSRCLATKREIHFTDSLRVGDRRDTNTDTHWWPLDWAQVICYTQEVS